MAVVDTHKLVGDGASTSRKNLKMQTMQYYIEKYDSVTSTNDLAKERAKSGAPAGLVLVADRQTAGRGRMGRSFYSEDGGLYMSILLRPEGDAADALSITTRAAVAVAKAIETHTGCAAAIKWVNDIYQNERKVCGILTEGQIKPDGDMEYAICGIGVNLREPSGGFPEELREVAGAIFGKDEPFDRDALVETILQNFFSGDADCYDEYVKRDMLRGKTVTVLRGGEPLCTAEVLGIDRDFSLRIRLVDGSVTALRTGEVSVKTV